jgi:acyl carrier protein
MNKTEINNKLIEIAQSNFSNHPKEIQLTTSPGDVDAWDSLGHMILINAIENKFKVKFDLEDMLGFESIQTIADALYTKLESPQ